MKTLLSAVLAYRYADETPAECVARIARSGTHAVYQEALLYVASIKPQHRDTNPKIDIYRDGLGKGDYRYQYSTTWSTTCRDALIHAMLAEPGVSFKACRDRTA